ncbi:MAG: FAD:protein FMN transferase, partial [Pseudomonadota bacterium]
MIIPATHHKQPSLEKVDGYYLGRFQAMASPCEVLMEIDDLSLAKDLLSLASNEAWRIEKKFSRYLDNNPIARLNNSEGKAIKVDNEIAHLLDFSQQCYEL